MKLDP
jgi:glucose/arabinose dehydrogenase